MKNLNATITIDPDGENIVSQEVLNDEGHQLKVSVNLNNADVYMEFTSRQALYDFAKSLLHEAVFGDSGQREFFPLITEGKALVVDGVRLGEGSSRVFVNVNE